MPWYNPTDPRQRNLMLGGLAFFIAIVPFRMYVLAPKQEEMDATQARIEQLETLNRRASVMAAQGGGNLEERLLSYERHVAKLEELIPATEEVFSLLDQISGLQRQYGVEQGDFIPEPIEPGTYYDKRAYEYQVVGEYHAVAAMITGIANLPRIITPVDLDVQVYEQPGRFPDMVAPIVARFRIETYVVPDRSNAPPPAVPGGEE